MSGPVQIDPEVRALLREIGGSAGTRLLRVTPTQLRKGLFERTPRVSSTAPFLRKAERHLLEAHREEVGRILYRYGYLLRMDSPKDRAFHHFGDQVQEPPRKDDVRESAHKALEVQQSRDLDTEVVGLLRECTRGVGPATPAQVMSAAMRVAPSHAIRKCLAMDSLGEGGGNVTAMRLLHNIREQCPSAMIDSYVLEGLGFIASKNEDHELASASYRTATLRDQDRIMPALFWFTASVQSENQDEAIEACHHIVGRAESERSVRWYKAQLVAHRGEYWEPTRRSKQLALQLRETLEPKARELLDAFA